MKRTFRFRIHPTQGQESTLTEWLNTCRILYNQSLSERNEAYKWDKSSINYYDQANALKEAKKGNGYLTAVHSQVLQDVLKRLDKVFQNFFLHFLFKDNLKVKKNRGRKNLEKVGIIKRL